MESELLVQIKQLTQLLEIQQQENTLLREQIAEMNRRLFGRKKETPPVDGQIDLLDDKKARNPLRYLLLNAENARDSKHFH